SELADAQIEDFMTGVDKEKRSVVRKSWIELADGAKAYFWVLRREEYHHVSHRLCFLTRSARSENVHGAEVNRAFILGEDVASVKEILATEDFTAAIGVPPPGVGVFSAPHDRVDAIGFSFHIFRDYRE
ncbi:MAG: hypothetical protein ACPGTU_15975, partial [Myxococcota bacterium]